MAMWILCSILQHVMSILQQVMSSCDQGYVDVTSYIYTIFELSQQELYTQPKLLTCLQLASQVFC